MKKFFILVISILFAFASSGFFAEDQEVITSDDEICLYTGPRWHRPHYPYPWGIKLRCYAEPSYFYYQGYLLCAYRGTIFVIHPPCEMICD